jgi:hypothetical protein
MMDSTEATEHTEISVPEDASFSIKSALVPESVQIRRAGSRQRNNNNNNSSTNNDHREVTFHQVQIRRYRMTLGDNPACQVGAPVSLDWQYEELPLLDLDDYEITRLKQRRKKLRHLVLSFYQRQHILQRMGYSPEELKKAAKGVSKARRQREKTMLFLPISKLEEVAQSVKRKVKRRLSNRKKSNADV